MATNCSLALTAVASPADLEIGDTAGWETCATGRKFMGMGNGAFAAKALNNFQKRL
jgi:hypothetical protein